MIVALALFAERGYECISTADIAQKAGLKNKGSIYYYFLSKEDLFLAVLENVLEIHLSSLETLVQQCQKVEFVEQQLLALLHKSCHYYQHYQPVVHFYHRTMLFP